MRGRGRRRRPAWRTRGPPSPPPSCTCRLPPAASPPPPPPPSERWGWGGALRPPRRRQADARARGARWRIVESRMVSCDALRPMAAEIRAIIPHGRRRRRRRRRRERRERRRERRKAPGINLPSSLLPPSAAAAAPSPAGFASPLAALAAGTGAASHLIIGRPLSIIFSESSGCDTSTI